MNEKFINNVIIQRRQDGLVAVIIKVTPKMITVLFQTSRSWKVTDWSKHYIESFFNIIGNTEAIDLQKVSEDMKKAFEKFLSN